MAEKRIRTQADTSILELSLDVLLLILTRLEYKDRLSISLVSKFFRSLPYGFVHKLTFYKCLPSDSAFRKLVAWFSSVSRIEIRSTRIARALAAIADSGLSIECLEIYGRPSFPNRDQMVGLARRLGHVKGLIFEWFSNVGDLEVAEFVHLFHSLEELDLSLCGFFNWSDAGIKKLALKCRNLRKVDLSHSKCLTARSLDALASCVNLEHISFDVCFGMSFQGDWNFVQKGKNLKSLNLPCHLFSNTPNLTLAKTKPACENLSHLSIDGGRITDAFLLIIAGLRAPLTIKLDLEKHGSYTMTGLSALLHAFQGLTRLNVDLPWPGSDTQDTEMSQLVKSLPHLKDVYLVSWSAVYATLFSMINNCQLLEHICIISMDRNSRCDVPQELRKNYSIQRICIDPWPDTLLKTALKLTCPSLKTLA